MRHIRRRNLRYVAQKSRLMGRGSQAGIGPNDRGGPKSRAAGKPESELAIDGDLITDDAAVRRFGSAKYLHPEEAALLAAERASNLLI